jgi:hypothetical protein
MKSSKRVDTNNPAATIPRTSFDISRKRQLHAIHVGCSNLRSSRAAFVSGALDAEVTKPKVALRD